MMKLVLHLLPPGRGRRLLPLFILLLALCRPAHAQDFIWAKTLAKGSGGGSNDGNSVAVDASGNVYTTGTFAGTADFDPGPGTFELSSAAAGSNDIFVSKLDASGDFVWARRMGGTGYDGGTSIAVDGSGNVHTTGYFAGTADFDPGPGTFELTSAGDNDIFVSQLDASGDFVRAGRLGGSGFDYGYSIAVDGSGNVHTTGYFFGTADFDPGAGTSNLTSSGGSADIFVSKLDASGDFVWARRLGGSNGDYGRSIAVDGSGNVHTTGYFRETADFDPGAGTFELTSAGSVDIYGFDGENIFVSKLDASGDFVWARRMGGASTGIATSIALDGSGGVHTTGSFYGTGDFDPGDGTFELTSAGSSDIFVSKLDASGDFAWARRMGGSAYEDGKSIALDASGGIYTTGTFRGTADFDPGAGTSDLTAAGELDIFVSKLNRNGNFVWARRMGGSANEDGRSIAVDGWGNVHTTGYFAGAADFDPGGGTFDMTPFGYEVFVSKLGLCTPPTAYGVTGGGSYCAGSGLAVGLADSESGVSYQLRREGGDVGEPVAGTGNALSFGSQTAAGTYTVVATRTGVGCTASMSGSAVLAVKPLPDASFTGLAGPYCADAAAVTLTPTTAGGTFSGPGVSGSTFTPANAGSGSTILYSVTVDGCTSSTSQSVSVNALPSVNAGQDQAVILGFGGAGSNCTSLTAIPAGGSGGNYSFTWNPVNLTGPMVNVCPQQTTTYTVTVTDGNGCRATDQVTVNVQDVRCGNRNQNVVICYYGVTQCVSEKIAKNYLKLGATLGGCGSSATRQGVPEPEKMALELSLKAFPNPVHDEVTVEVFSPAAGTATLEVLDVTGRARQSRQQPLVQGLNEVEFRLGTLPASVYLIRATDAAGRQGTVRVSKE